MRRPKRNRWMTRSPTLRRRIKLLCSNYQGYSNYWKPLTSLSHQGTLFSHTNQHNYNTKMSSKWHKLTLHANSLAKNPIIARQIPIALSSKTNWTKPTPIEESSANGIYRVVSCIKISVLQNPSNLTIRLRAETNRSKTKVGLPSQVSGIARPTSPNKFAILRPKIASCFSNPSSHKTSKRSISKTFKSDFLSSFII